MMCYNCHQITNHIGADCPMQQMFKRCPSCNVVAKTEAAHKPWCKSKTFLSTYTGESSTVYEVKEVMQLSFKDIDEKQFVIDNRREIEIGSNPLWLSTIDCFVSKIAHHGLSLASSRPKKKIVTMVNKDNKPVVSICFDESVLIVNGRYKIEKNGTISTKWNAANEIFEPHMCQIKVLDHAKTLKFRVYIWEMYFTFVVYPIGPILMDQQYPAAQKSLLPHKNDADTSTIAEGSNSKASTDNHDDGMNNASLQPL